MPRPDHVWRHVNISVHRSWLPGDPRGFRSRKHRIHSSGDYKNPPPPQEHEGLRHYNKERVPDPRNIPRDLRRVVCESIRKKFEQLGVQVLVIAVSGMHAHFLAELPINLTNAKRLVGQVKGVSSRAVSRNLPGQLWADGGSFDPVNTPGHHRNTYFYVRDKQGPGAWVWTFEDGHRGFRTDDNPGLKPPA